ncbi:MAG: SDR family NAD(P)-dependent oxidoreductase, partial [Chloroflexota bacterium]|nr:SDR family NAD(P)-dependent oxidoreductase [Chloroflexota bacterium]
IGEFWGNISGGIKSIRRLTDAEVLAAGADPSQVHQPGYVKAGGVLDGIELFDAGFFGFTPREAEALDPQVRLFLQCTWAALEDGACDPQTYTGRIGVFAGKLPSMYRMRNLQGHPELVETVGPLQLAAGNDADALASLVAYKFDLRGPSISVQTFCSTSLVAVHLACQSLLTQDCDVALAGGVAIDIPHGAGYTYVEGGILSPDGECRAFDASANGSVMGGGLGVVVLKRLADALEDGDQIYAVIRGSATNNDGVVRASYGAPGLNGQAAVIAAALANAGVDPRTIGYVAGHGTGTRLGDAVELGAMLKVFPLADESYCALGSIKPNIGHLDRASGVANLIVAALAVKNGCLPPSVNYLLASPELRLEQSGICVNEQARPWPAPGGWPRRAGVSSFGLGGTNAHVILEEAPPPAAATSVESHHLLILSARTETALERATDNLIAHLQTHPELDLADVAYTLQAGRAAFNYRRVLVATDHADAVAGLRARARSTHQTYRDRAVRVLEPAAGPPNPEVLARLRACGLVREAAADPAPDSAVTIECRDYSEPELLDLIGSLWLDGVRISWAGLHPGERRHRISLPTYPFEEQPYWIEARASGGGGPRVGAGKRAEAADWFYRPAWTESPRRSSQSSVDGLTLVFEDTLGLGAALAEQMVARGGAVARVLATAEGEAFAQIGVATYQLDPLDRAGYRALLGALTVAPARIVHLWSLNATTSHAGRGGGGGKAARAAFARGQTFGYYSLQSLTHALGNRIEPLMLWTVTADAQPVTGLEVARPEQAPLLGLGRVVHQEQPSIGVRAIDVTLPLGGAWQVNRLAAHIAGDVVEPPEELEIALRGGRRWTLTYEPVHLAAPAAPALRQGGVYLVTGGLGGIGRILCCHLAGIGARIVLTTRQAFSSPADWPDWVQELSATGAEVLVRQADVVDEPGMRALLGGIDARFGRLDGVFHTAGVSGEAFFAAAAELSVEQTEAHFGPKVHGLYTLERVLAGRKLDFCVLWSSVSSVLGGLTFGAYTAANRFIDAFAHAHNARSPQRWTAVNWDTWRTRRDQHETFGATVAEFEMAPAEALDALERVLADRRWTQLVNSTGSLEARLDQWVRSIGRQPAADARAGHAHPRPDLATPYTAPTTDVEARIAAIWAAALGLEKVGIDDSFLELGGHSLIAIQLISRLREAFQTQLPLSLLFQAPTVAELAVAIELAIIEELEQLAS